MPDGEPASHSPQPLISVVVPTRDRPEALARCLDALAVQTVADQLEIVVVDDGSQAALEVASVIDRYVSARLIRRDGAGPAAARNAGARAARGAFLCFTDDDCIPRVDWAERLVAALRTGADAAAGTTISRGGHLAEASEIIAHAPAAAPAPPGSDLAFAPSNNVACAKAVFEVIPFDESYPDAAGEDRDWCARLAAAGFVLRSEPAACTVHHQELTLHTFMRRQLRYGEGAYRFRRSADARPLEPPSFYAALLRTAFARGFRVGALVVAAQAATGAGFIRGWAKARPAPQSRDGLRFSRR